MNSVFYVISINFMFLYVQVYLLYFYLLNMIYIIVLLECNVILNIFHDGFEDCLSACYIFIKFMCIYIEG
jgi:hypothetical protein